LNGQRQRKRIIREIALAVEFDRVLETGTSRGTPTGFFAAVSASQCSALRTTRGSSVTAADWHHLPEITIKLSDSRQLLAAHGGAPQAAWETVVDNLDAHWAEDLPLADEPPVSWDRVVVMIEHRQVGGVSTATCSTATDWAKRTPSPSCLLPASQEVASLPDRDVGQGDPLQERIQRGFLARNWAAHEGTGATTDWEELRTGSPRALPIPIGRVLFLDSHERPTPAPLVLAAHPRLPVRGRLREGGFLFGKCSHRDDQASPPHHRVEKYEDPGCRLDSVP